MKGVVGHGQAPPVGAASHGQATYRGGRPRPKPFTGAAASNRGRPRAWLAPAGVVLAGVGTARDEAARGSPAAMDAACKDSHWCRPRAATAAHADDVQRYSPRQRKGGKRG
ncbi:hypothetical protein GW17_00047276 [Ensete ventricosum]|nr:hypothetical protein GW17_00047276 [Ensete ventricosum]